MCRCRPSSAPELAKCGLNRAVADGDLSITHLQVARESWWRRSHISWNDCRRRRRLRLRLRLLDMQARRGEARQRAVGDVRRTCFSAPFSSFLPTRVVGFNHSRAGLMNGPHFVASSAINQVCSHVT
jgi:hypothetical protein